MRKRRRRDMRMIKIFGIALSLSGAILIIHTVPLYIWYAALASAVLILLLLIYIT